jgi:hypothetical protein
VRWAGHLEITGQPKNEYRIIFGKREEKGSLVRRRRGSEGSTIQNPTEVRYGLYLPGSDRDQRRTLVKTEMGLQASQKAAKKLRDCHILVTDFVLWS